MSFSFIHNVEQRSSHIMETALQTVVAKWHNSPAPIWRAEHSGFEPTTRYITVIFRTAHDRRVAADQGWLSQIRDDLVAAVKAGCDVSLQIDIHAVTFTDLDADTTFLTSTHF